MQWLNENDDFSMGYLHGAYERDRKDGVRGFAKKKKMRNYYGSGWADPGLTRNFFFLNRPKIALNQC